MLELLEPKDPVTTKLDIVRKYYEDPALSQSRIKELLGISKPVSESTFSKGKLIDTMLTMPEHVDDLYIVADNSFFDKDSMMYKMVDYIVKNNLAFEKYDILDVYELFDYQKRWNPDTKVNKLLENTAFIDFMKTKGNKEVVLSNEFDMASNIVERLREYVPDDAYTQVPVYRPLDGVMCKGLVDLVFNNTIYDLKVLSVSLDSVKYSLRKMRTDMQLAFYRDLMGFETLPRLLVYSNIDNDIEVFEMSEIDMQAGKYGLTVKQSFQLKHNGEMIDYEKEYFGYMDGIMAYKHGMLRKKEESIWM